MDKNEELLIAARSCDFLKFVELIEDDANPMYIGLYGDNLINSIFACSDHNADMAEILIDHADFIGFDLNATFGGSRWTIAHYLIRASLPKLAVKAVKRMSVEALSKSSNTESSSNVAEYAAFFGYWDVVYACLDKGVNPYRDYAGNQILFSAIRFKNFPLIERLLANVTDADRSKVRSWSRRNFYNMALKATPELAERIRQEFPFED